jgi:chromosome segregation ATPase
LPILSDEQIRKIVSANESLQVQLEDANAMLAAREQEIDYLSTELAESTALRSKLDGQLDEIESIQNRLGEKQMAAKGAREREFELHQELTEMAILNKKYNELIQDYAYLQSQFKDIKAQLTALQERNFQLDQTARQLAETQSLLENSLLEIDSLKYRINILEAQKFLKEI